MTETSPGVPPRVLLVTKPDCHLCSAARETVARVSADLGVAWQEVSIAADRRLAEQFAEEVPVVLVDGVQRDFWVIDEGRLRRLLQQPKPSS